MKVMHVSSKNVERACARAWVCGAGLGIGGSWRM